MKKNVCIYNEHFTVVCEEDESASIDQAQAHFNEAISTVKAQINHTSRERILMMAGLLMAQELLSERQQTQTQISTLLDHVNDVLTK